MTVKSADRVLETTTTQGTGTISLAGPVSGFQGFLDGVSTGSKVPYIINDATDWEVGIGTVTSGSPDTLSRDTVHASSNSNAAVNWGPGTRNVRLGPTANLTVIRDENLNLINGFGTVGGTATAQTLTLDPAPTAMSDGMLLIWPSAGAITTASQINVNGLGAKDIRWKGAALKNGAFAASDLMMGYYRSGTNVIELITPPKYAMFTAKGTAIASAGTTDIGAADSQFVSVTGTTTITSLGASTDQNHVWVQFDGALTLTHHASDLILPTGANITTEAGDVAEFVRISGSSWKCVSYSRTSGKPLTATIDLAAVQTTTSGTDIDFTSIFAGAKRVSVNFSGVSTNGSAALLVQLGDSGGIEATGYLGACTTNTTSATTTNYTAGIGVTKTVSTHVLHGTITFTLIDAAAFLWAASGVIASSDSARSYYTAGSKALSDVLDRIRIKASNGTDAFTAGKINLLIEY